jgi:adenylate cyclase
LFVIARNSSFTYKGHAVEIKQVARELGVRYVLEGSVRRSASRVRIVAQLIDADAGNHIWAERYDRALEDVFAVQDEITAAVVAAILPAVADAEQRRALRKPPESLGAWEAHQRGMWHFGKASAEQITRAQGFFQRAITLDPSFTSPYAFMATAYALQAAAFASRSLEEGARLAIEWATKAVELDANDAEAQASLAWAIALGGVRPECWERVSLALEINPNSVWAHWVRGALLVYTGRPSEGRTAMLTSLRLNPCDPVNMIPLSQIAVSYYFENDYPQALEAALRVLSRYPAVPRHPYVVASLAQLGRLKDAREALQRAMTAAPHAFEFFVHSRPPWFRQEDHEHVLDGLRKAGWQG